MYPFLLCFPIEQPINWEQRWPPLPFCWLPIFNRSTRSYSMLSAAALLLQTLQTKQKVLSWHCLRSPSGPCWRPPVQVAATKRDQHRRAAACRRLRWGCSSHPLSPTCGVPASLAQTVSPLVLSSPASSWDTTLTCSHPRLLSTFPNKQQKWSTSFSFHKKPSEGK